jgi:hypothetical protein
MAEGIEYLYLGESKRIPPPKWGFEGFIVRLELEPVVAVKPVAEPVR